MQSFLKISGKIFYFVIFLVITLFITNLNSYFKPKNLTAAVCTGIDTGDNPTNIFFVDEDMYSFTDDGIKLIQSGIVTDTYDVISSSSFITDATLANDKIYYYDSNQFNTPINVFDISSENSSTIALSGGLEDFGPLIGDDLYLSAAYLYTLDTSTDTLSAPIDLGVGDSITAGEILLVGTDLYITSPGGDYVSVVDTNTNTLTDSIFVGDAQQDIFLSGTDLYVLAKNDPSVFIIDTTTNTVSDTITFTGVSVDFILANGELYVETVEDNSLRLDIFNTSTTALLDSIDLSGDFSVYRENLFLSGTDLYVLHRDAGDSDAYITEIDSTTRSVVDSTSFGTYAHSGILNNGDIYVSDSTENKIYVFNLSTGAIRDACGPVLESAEIDGNTVVLTYDEDLDSDSIPDSSSFYIEIDGEEGEISDVEVVDNIVIITIVLPAEYSDIVILSYTVPLTNPTQDPSGNKALPFNNQSVDNTTQTCSLIEVGTNPYSATIVGSNLYVNNSAETSISIVNLGTNLEVDTIDIGAGVFYSTAVDDLLYLYDGSNIYVVDTTTNTLDETLSLSGYIFGTLVDDHIYLNSADSNEIHTLDTATNTIDDTISVGTYPYSSVLYGTDLYVFNQSSDNVSVIDTTTNTVTDTISVGGSPYAGAVVDSYVYVNNYTDSTISVIDTSTKSVIDTFATPSGAHFSLYDENGFLYLTQYDTSSIAIIDVSDNSVAGNVDLGDGVGPYFLNDYNDLIYISDVSQSQMLVIDKDTQELYACPVNFTLTYSAGSGGSISGTTPQTVESGENGSPVTAVPNTGYSFAGWSDLSQENPRTDLNVSSNISVTANFTAQSNSASSGASQTGTTAYGRFRNLIEMEKYEEAYTVIRNFPEAFTSENGPYTFCDTAFFIDFMKKKDVDGRFSSYNGAVVTEVSKLQSFINNLLMYEYLQASGPVDGIFGPLTHIGVERLQKLLNSIEPEKEKLIIDGIVGPFTREAVNNFCLPN